MSSSSEDVQRARAFWSAFNAAELAARVAGASRDEAFRAAREASAHVPGPPVPGVLVDRPEGLSLSELALLALARGDPSRSGNLRRGGWTYPGEVDDDCLISLRDQRTLRRLSNPYSFRNMDYHKLRVQFDYSELHPELRRWRLAFQVHLDARRIPLFLENVEGGALRFGFFETPQENFGAHRGGRVGRLGRAEWSVVAGLGLEVARAAAVPVLWSEGDPALFSLGEVVRGMPDAERLDASMARAWRLTAELHRNWERHDRARCQACAWSDANPEGELPVSSGMPGPPRAGGMSGGFVSDGPGFFEDGSVNPDFVSKDGWRWFGREPRNESNGDDY